MGLTLCRWVCDDSRESRNILLSSASSSAFLPLSVTPSVRLATLLDTPSVAPGDLRSQWSPTHRSPNLWLCELGTSVCRPPVEGSSDAAQSAVGVRTGLHVWELRWEEGQRGSHALVGVSTGKCSMQMSGYTALVGGDSCSWGWELSTNQLWHGGKQVGLYPVGRTQQSLKVPERVLVVVDADAGTLGYVIDDCFLGHAFKDLPSGAELFLAVSCVWGGATIHLRYLNGMKREAPSLISLGRRIVRQSLGWDRKAEVQCPARPLALERLLLASG
ncbi:SPRY domain-containing SOCS box protein 2-like [Brachyhypopomus gauderio]|uniref:SPRY domain-containing SOCS box protein 2-like n=1 Tax=Brachyhypopomus gauderio TaxID=698409 RepID=UPI004041E29A